MTTYTIYTYGSGYIEAAILQAIASFAAGNDFLTLVKVIGAVGMLIFFIRVLAWGTQKVNHMSYIKYLVGIMLIYAVMFSMKVNVQVQDTVVNAPTNAMVINNVPWGVGAILSEFSTLTYSLTNDMENAFSTPQSIDLTNAGVGFSLTSQNYATGSTVLSPSLYRNFDQYISNCVLPGISTGNLSVNTVQNSTDLLTEWATYTAGGGANLLTTWFSEAGGVSAAADGGATYPAGETTDCGVETAYIQSAMSYYVQQDLGPQEAGMLNMTWAQYQTLLGATNSGIYNVSQSSTQYLMQATAANQFNVAMLDLAKMSGVNANGLAYGTALAQSTQESQFTMSGILAGRYMPVVYGIMFAIFTGASLLLLLLMLLPHPMQYIKMYFELLLWLTIWPALMAVYNFIVDLIIQYQASGYFTNYSGTLNGIAISNVHMVSNWVQSSLAWVGYLSWSIPMLSYAIVSGSAMAMTSMVGSMDAAVGGGVSAGASQVGKGDVSFGNTSARNMNVSDVSGYNEKWDTSRSNMGAANKMQGDLENQAGDVGKFEENNGNGVTNIIQSFVHPGDVSGTDATTGVGLGMVNGKVISASSPVVNASVGKTASEMASKSYTASLNRSVADINAKGSQLSGAQKQQFTEDKKMTATAVAEKTWGKNWKHSKTAKSWWKWAVDATAGVNVGNEGPVSGNVGGAASVGTGGEHTTATERAKIAQANASYIKGVSTSLGTGGSLAYSASSGTSTSLNKSITDGLSVANSYDKAVKTDKGIVINALPAYLNSRLSGKGLKGIGKLNAGLGILNRLGTGQGTANFQKFLKGYNPVGGVGSGPAAIKAQYQSRKPGVDAKYKNLAPSTNPAKIKQEIATMTSLAKDGSNPARGINGSKHMLSNAEGALHYDERAARFYKKKGLNTPAATFASLAKREQATIAKIKEQRGIETYVNPSGKKYTPPTDNVLKKVKTKIPDDKA